MSVQTLKFSQSGQDSAQVTTSTALELTALDGVTATATEINTLAGVTAGTVVAGKAVVTTTNKTVDALNITALTLATVALGATATELNLIADQSFYTETLTSVTPTMTLTKRVHTIDSTLGAQAFTPAVPGAANIGVTHVLHMAVMNGDSVLTGTNVLGLQKTTDVLGTATGVSATFNDVGDSLVLIGVSATKWLVLQNIGCTIA